MDGYPKVINTKQDLINLLDTPEFKEQALADLNRLNNLAIATATVKRATKPVDAAKPEGEWVTETIENPNPVYKSLGFVSAKEVSDLLEERQAVVGKEAI